MSDDYVLSTTILPIYLSIVEWINKSNAFKATYVANELNHDKIMIAKVSSNSFLLLGNYCATIILGKYFYL